MKYQKKPVIVDAVQWNKHGDHPESRVLGNEVTLLIEKIRQWKEIPGPGDGYSGDQICPECDRALLIHGWMPSMTVDNEEMATLRDHFVCPGDWIVIHKDGSHYKRKPADFDREFEPVKEIKVSRTVLSLKPPFSPMQHPEPRVYRSVSDWPNGLTRNKVDEVYGNYSKD